MHVVPDWARLRQHQHTVFARTALALTLAATCFIGCQAAEQLELEGTCAPPEACPPSTPNDDAGPVPSGPDGGVVRPDVPPIPDLDPEGSIFQVRTATVIDVEPFVPSDARSSHQLDRFALRRGYLYDFVVLADNIGVLDWTEPRGPNCGPRGWNELRFVSPVDLRVLRIRASPECSTAITRHPADPSMMILGSKSQGELKVSRIDLHVNVFERLNVETWRDDEDPDSYFVDLLSLGPDDRMAVVSGRVDESPAVRSERLLLFNARLAPTTLRSVDLETQPGSGRTTGSTAVSLETGGDRVLLLDDEDDDVTWRDRISGARLLERSARGPDRVTSLAVLGLEGGGAVVAQSGDRPACLLVSESDNDPNRAVELFGGAAIPTALAVWPADPSKLAVGFTVPIDEGAWTAGIALFDPASAQFLPGAAAIGAGVVSQFEPGADGSLYALLPWSGQIARLQAR